MTKYDAFRREPPGSLSRVTSSDDLRETLLVAEDLLGSVERQRDRLRFAELGLAGLGVVAILLFGFGLAEASSTRVMLLLACFLTLLIAFVTWDRIVIRWNRRLNHDERVMLELVSMVREMVTAVSEYEDWSHTRLREVRARLSRFGISRSG